MTMPEIINRLKFLTPNKHNPDRPLFVFLPGMDGSGKLLQTQTESLKQAFDIRCLAIPPDDLNDWDILSAHVVDLIKRELRSREKHSVYLCGESFGGCLTLRVALREPELFSRIILVNPASSFVRRPLLQYGAQLLPVLPDIVYRGTALALLPFLVAWKKVNKEDRRALLNEMRSVPPKCVGWRLSLLGEFNLEDYELHRLTQPVLVLAGTADRVLPSVCEAERLVENLPNAQTILLPKSGHACLLESDLELYTILKDYNFLEADVPQETPNNP